MKSINFEFLRKDWPELASLAGFAEQYAVPDPSGSLVKLRSFIEQMVESIYERFGLQRPHQANLIDLLDQTTFQDVVPRVVVTTMHAIRVHGNKAAHGAKVKSETTLWLLKEAHRLGQWLIMTAEGNASLSIPTYREPSPEILGQKSKSQLQREKKAILQKLATQEAQMQKLLDDMAAVRKEAKVAKASATELQERLQAAQQAVSVLDFTEEQTRRRLIDTMLTAADWNVGVGGKDTADVRQEFEVQHQPTDSGEGYVDYVLFDPQKDLPLAIVEAKKTSINVEAGREQARLYADGLEKMYGQRPVIFYTNGFDIRIWDDANGYAQRRIFGFYSKDSLEYLIHQRKTRQDLTKTTPDKDIAGWLFQIEAVTRVMEAFQLQRRKTLLVQATGTGKTRVAVSICNSLIKAGWAKRILFLCDRRELRKQAHNAFKDFLRGEPRINVTAETYKDRDRRIYLATYPAMMKVFETFDVGFFDLVIADESHRSIYNRYRDIFLHFDSLQIGLTATPRSAISHNTYKLFGCNDDVPTSYYSYTQAVEDSKLTPFEVEAFTTPFLREGISYTKMTEQQRRQLEEEEQAPETIEYDQRQVDKHIFNKDTNRRVLENLMTRGIKVAEGSRLGKTIIFARNHRHAELLQELFDEMYPQFAGGFCRVIDNYIERTDELIDDLKGIGKHNDLTIAISVDMLDTGIDVPEIVNLVFAKPVYSYVKFWQMIGRGTRLCPDLFGPRKDKEKFLIFDHWGNFEYFGEGFIESEAKAGKSVQQILFEDRIRLAEIAVQIQQTDAFELATELLVQDVNDLPDNTLSIREKWRTVKAVQQDGVIKRFDAATVSILKTEIAPLMQWRNISGFIPAVKFDMLCSRLQSQLLKGSSTFGNLRGQLVNQVQQLQINLNPVKAKIATIEKVKSKAFWDGVTVPAIEEVRKDLRDIMKYMPGSDSSGFEPKFLDITEDNAGIKREKVTPKLEGLELIAYRHRVQSVLIKLIDNNQSLQKVRAGEPVTEQELDEITALVLAQDSDLVLNDLLEYYPEVAGDLQLAIRTIIGMDADVVEERFTRFAQNYKLNSVQLRFMALIKNHIHKYGAIELTQLYEAPFTALNHEGLDGVFPDEQQADALLRLVESFFKPNKGV